MIHVSDDHVITTGETANVHVRPWCMLWKGCNAVNLVVEEGEGCNITASEIDEVIEALQEAKRKIGL